MDATITHRVFDRMYLAATDVERTNSHAVPVSRRNVVYNVVVHNSDALSGTDKLVFQLEGTYDGVVWSTTGLTNLVEITSSKVQRSTSEPTAVDYGYLRLRATIGGTTTRAVFDADIAFAD